MQQEDLWIFGGSNDENLAATFFFLDSLALAADLFLVLRHPDSDSRPVFFD